MKVHLLHRDRDVDFSAELIEQADDLVLDFELATILQSMTGGNKYLLDVCRRILLTTLESVDDIAYRQGVLADCVALPDMVRELYAIGVASDEERRGLFWGRSSRFPAAILSSALSEMEMFLGLLHRLREVADTYVTHVASDGFRALFTSLQRELDDEYFETFASHLKRLRFRNGVLLSATLGRDNSGKSYVLRSPELAKGRWTSRVGLTKRESYSFTVHPRDEAGAKSLSDLTSRGVNLVANAAAQSADHIQSYFRMLRAEVGFYTAALQLREVLLARGATLCVPEPLATPSDVDADELADTSLYLRTTSTVVGNAVHSTGRRLVVVTGANSGGKSTLLRSLGQAQLMMQCGLFVTARSFRASLIAGLFTHFNRDEDASMVSGRLVEELVRMREIADSLTTGCAVYFNESFAATNEREGSEIARQVVGALLDNGVRVFFVTHQFDLANSLYAHRDAEPALFLRAARADGGERPFRLVEEPPLPTSYGEDLYEKIFADSRPS